MWKFLVKNQKIEILEREVIASDQISFVTLKFIFDGDWKKFHKVVQFSQCDETYNLVLGTDGTSWLLPAELHAGTVKMSAFGYDTDNTDGLRATTIPVTLHIRSSGFVDDGTAPIPPTPDLYAQLLQKINETIKGENGKSAYEVVVENGYSRTEQEWLASLKGEPGQQGEKGEPGEKGNPGKPGKQGIPGEKGEPGRNGKDGSDGLSAYKITVQNGFIGTESDWLVSLKGKQGDPGQQGLQGIQGDKGEPGTNGQDGKNGFSPVVKILGVHPETAKTGCFLRITYFDEQKQKLTTIITENLKADSEDPGSSGASVVKEIMLNTLDFSDPAETLENYGDSIYIYESSAENFQVLAEIVEKWGGVASNNNFVNKSNPDCGINMANWSETNVGTGILFTHKLELFTGRLLFSIYANFSNWTNQLLHFHLIQAETPEQALTKALAGEYAQSMDYTLAGALAQTADIFAFGSVSAGNYYLYIDGTTKGDNSNFTYAKIEYLNYGGT